MRVIGIDPDSKTACAAEITEAGPRAVYSNPSPTGEYSVLHCIPGVLAQITSKVDMVVVEGQELYQGKAEAGPALLYLAHITGAWIMAAMQAFPAVQILIPLPKTWKGQTPKSIHQTRTYNSFGWKSEQLKTYSYPTGCAKVAQVKGYHSTHQADWHCLGDCLGLARYGLEFLRLQRSHGI